MSHPMSSIEAKIAAMIELLDFHSDWDTPPKPANCAFNQAIDILSGIVHSTNGIEQLVPYLEHSSVQLRGFVATELLFHRPELAKPVLEQLATKPGIVGFEATQVLSEWHKGQLKPLSTSKLRRGRQGGGAP